MMRPASPETHTTPDPIDARGTDRAAGKARRDRPDGRQPRISARDITVAYQPILRGAAIATLCYFLFDMVTRILFPGGPFEPAMTVSLALSSLLVIGVRRYLGKRLTTNRVEGCGLLMAGLLVLNANLQQLLDFQEENLAYAVLMMPIFATMLPRLRSISVTILVSLMCYFGLIALNIPDRLGDYLWIGLSGVAAAVAIALIVRNAVIFSIKSHRDAIRDRKTAEALAAEARHLAECDALTNLPNRRSFFVALESRLERLRQHGEPFILGLIDLDGFKPVNDTYGHAAGDEMLKTVARRLGGVAGDSAMPARLGGDEFALIAPAPCTRAETVLQLGHRIEAALSRPYDLGDYTCKGSGSVGLLICNDPSLSTHDLMERADHALYFAKRALQGKAVLFNAALEHEMTASSQVDKALRRCDYEAEFTIKFQPQYDIIKSKIVGFEALARWDSPELGPVSPDVFIAAAERAGLIRPLTQVLLSKALAEMASWPDHLILAFNLSAHDLMSPQAMDSVLETVRASGLPAKRIEFEITETAMMSDFNQARRAINRISEAGHSVALDDFGVGYSSLQYLQQLPVSKLKIDRSFVSQMLEDSSSYKIVRTMLSLSQTLDLGCVIEGVESEAQMHILRSLGARHVQGYLIGAPMAADAVIPSLGAKLSFGPSRPDICPPTHRRARA
ncbi:putative bifunctional diguanylate cyclase/phosphodiesterase [Maricaulis maris]|jgi:diguanylate cyclase (GGDEF)-like protein|uniref:putative bifunctional diguanylate cyclase/phosphodiesterase n=1 Tax=Maricaulis maris TaxID=74318 RepID=UPI0029226028|nr:hypothetical protein MACH15_17110 [Maricaulis maris]